MSTDVTLVGRIGRDDPELRFTPAGKAVVNFSMVTDRRKFNDQTKQWEPVDATWWRVNAWDQLAERVAEHLHPGDAVIVKGTASLRKYDRSDGTKGTSLECQAWNIGLDLRWTEPGAKTQRASRQPAGEDSWSSGPPAPATTPARDPWATEEAPF
jgi:single-strand DNA-binding protein